MQNHKSAIINPKLLIIAGSDSGGGAGIQADIKTACAHKVFATTAITALTAQNTLGVSGVIDTPPEFVAAQINAVLSDIGADAIKIGMLSNAQIIEAVYNSIINVQCSIILDTVMLAKGGAALLAASAVDALKTLLIPLATIVTPNIPEAEVLAGISIKTPDDMAAAGMRILDLGAKAVLVKGGHLEGDEVVDILIQKNQKSEIRNPKLHSKNTHGTGCTLASAIACNLALGLPLQKAVENGINYVRNAILTAPDIGQGHGPLNFFSCKD